MVGVHTAAVRCVLELRSPSDGTGWAENWSFSGQDALLLLDCLQRLGEYATAPPVEVWNSRRSRHVVRDGDRWRAAMLLWRDDGRWQRDVFSPDPMQAEEAWTAAGALRLAYMLPAGLDDLAEAIRARFATP